MKRSGVQAFAHLGEKGGAAEGSNSRKASDFDERKAAFDSSESVRAPRHPHILTMLSSSSHAGPAVTAFGDAMSIECIRTIPILRIFSVEKAKEFYIGWLGFKIEWEHQFEQNTRRYMQVSRGHLVLHLSEHHGDACPGSAVSVEMQGLGEFHREIVGKNYKYNRPGLEHTPGRQSAVR